MTGSQRFGISAFNPGKFVELSAAEFAEVLAARKLVLSFLDIEAVFDVLIENFIEFEQELAVITIGYMALVARSHVPPNSDALKCSRRLSNLLSAARSYIDQVPSLLGAIQADRKGAKEWMKGLLSTEYNNRFGYRFMDALRNHAQHQGLPVETISFRSKWTTDDLLEIGLEICISKESLVENTELNAKFRKSLRDKAEDQFALRPLVRDYIAGLCHIHEKVREANNAAVESAKKKFAGAHSRYLDRFPDVGDLPGLSIVETDQKGSYSAVYSISSKTLEYMDLFASKNTLFQNLEARFITTKDEQS